MNQLKHIQRRFGKDAAVMQVFMELVATYASLCGCLTQDVRMEFVLVAALIHAAVANSLTT